MSRFYSLEQAPLNSRSSARAIAAANNGLLFDIGDMSTLYRDAAGTTPVTAVEQPVGLVLDKSQGLMLGPELVTGFVKTGDNGINTVTLYNDGFDINQIDASSVATASIIGTFTAGKIYKITADVVVTAGAFKIQNVNWGGVAYIINSNVLLIRCTNSTNIIDVYRNSAGNNAISMRNISVRELYGNHATQPVTASRPTLSARKNVLLATETLATQSVTTIAAQYTLSFTGTGSVTLSGAATGTLTGTGAANRVSLTVTPTAGTLTLTVSGSVTKAQLELGAAVGPYQRVNTATDYDTNPALFPKYLKFDGIDDYLNLQFMNLYVGGAASIIAARDAVSQATDTYIISERSTTNGNPKYFPSRQLASGGNMDSYVSDDTAAVVLDTIGSAFSGVSDKVIRSVVDTGNNIKLFKNGALAADDNYTRSGALTLNNTTIGASVSTTTSNYASMKLYGLIVTKSALTDAQRVRCERFLARKAGVML